MLVVVFGGWLSRVGLGQENTIKIELRGKGERATGAEIGTESLRSKMGLALHSKMGAAMLRNIRAPLLNVSCASARKQEGFSEGWGGEMKLLSSDAKKRSVFERENRN